MFDFILLISSTQFHITILPSYLTYLHSPHNLRLSLKYTGCRFLIKLWICFSISSNAEKQSSGAQLLESSGWGWEWILWSQLSTRRTKYNSIRLSPVTKRLVFLRVKHQIGILIIFCQNYYNLQSFCLTSAVSNCLSCCKRNI